MNRKIAILEDDPIIAETARLMIEEFNGYTVCKVFHTGKSALNWLLENPIDLVMVDIDLGEGMNGVNLAEQLNKLNIPFAYVTSYSDQGTLSNALQFDPVGYLVKPFNRSNLFAALELAFSKVDKEEYILIQDGKTQLKFKASELIYFMAEGNYCEIYTKRNRHVLKRSLKSIEELLPERFVRIHRNCIVNVDCVEKIQSAVHMSSGQKLDISRTYRNNLLQQFKE